MGSSSGVIWSIPLPLGQLQIKESENLGWEEGALFSLEFSGEGDDIAPWSRTTMLATPLLKSSPEVSHAADFPEEPDGQSGLSR